MESIPPSWCGHQRAAGHPNPNLPRINQLFSGQWSTCSEISRKSTTTFWTVTFTSQTVQIMQNATARLVLALRRETTSQWSSSSCISYTYSNKIQEYFYLRQGGYVFCHWLFVCLLAMLHKNFGTDLHQIFRGGLQWANAQTIKFWWHLKPIRQLAGLISRHW